jgi:hypothetical protein
MNRTTMEITEIRDPYLAKSFCKYKTSCVRNTIVSLHIEENKSISPWRLVAAVTVALYRLGEKMDFKESFK